MTKSQRRRLNRKVRQQSVIRHHVTKPHTLEYVEGDLISEANDLRGLMVSARGNTPILAKQDYLTVWNDKAEAFNDPARNKSEGWDWQR